jgi:hypothetical protein
LVVSKGGHAIHSGHDQFHFQYLGNPNRLAMAGPGNAWTGILTFLLAVAVRGRFPLPISSSHAFSDSISDSSAFSEFNSRSPI